MEPRFPLPTAPLCRTCGQSCTRDIVLPGSPNGNAGRPYYACIYGTHQRRFSSWDDYQGITRGNPPCDCTFTSRRSRANRNEFFSCPVGSCYFNQNAPIGVGYQGAQVVAATANLNGTTPQGVQGQVVASNSYLAVTQPQWDPNQVVTSNDHLAATPPQSVQNQLVASNDHLTTVSPPRVQGQVAAPNDLLARTASQGVQSQIPVFNNYSAANAPRIAVEATPKRSHGSDTASPASGAQGSDVGSSSSTLDKARSEGKKKHRYCGCVVM